MLRAYVCEWLDCEHKCSLPLRAAGIPGNATTRSPGNATTQPRERYNTQPRERYNTQPRERYNTQPRERYNIQPRGRSAAITGDTKIATSYLESSI